MTSTAQMRGLVVLAAASLALSACSSSSASDADAAPADIVAAQAVVDEYTPSPTSLGLDVPLSKVPDSGKYVITVETPQPISSAKNDAIQQAMDLLGWRYERIVQGTDAEAAPKALDQAIALKPDAIHISGSSLSLLTKQLASAEVAGIPIIGDTIAEPLQGSMISNSLDAGTQVEEWGKMVASKVVVDSGGDARIALFSITDLPILTVFTDAFTAQIEATCPGCRVETVNQQIADLGTKTPQSVVSTLQRSPDTDYAIFSFGDLTTGVDAALRAAGLQDQVTLGGQTPNPSNIEALKDGDDGVWVGFPVQILGWRVVDMLARHFNGDDLAPADAALMPTQLLTKDTVDTAVLDQTGFYAGVADYRDQFETLWNK